MSRIGTVQALNGKYAIISSNRRGVCEGCSDKSACSFDTTPGKTLPETLTAINSVGAQTGDQVEFDLAGHTELKNSFLVWIVPLIGLIIGAFAGSQYHLALGFTTDSGTLLGLIIGLAIGFSGVMIYERLFVIGDKTLPILLRIVSNPTCTERH